MEDTLKHVDDGLAEVVEYKMLSLKVDSLLKKLTVPLRDISAIVTFLLMGFITLDVFLRTVFNRPIAGSIEICEVLMVVLCFAVFPFTQSNDKQLGIYIFTAKLSEATRTVLGVFTSTIAAIYLAILSSQMLKVTVKFYGSSLKRVPGNMQVIKP